MVIVTAKGAFAVTIIMPEDKAFADFCGIFEIPCPPY